MTAAEARVLRALVRLGQVLVRLAWVWTRESLSVFFEPVVWLWRNR